MRRCRVIQSSFAVSIATSVIAVLLIYFIKHSLSVDLSFGLWWQLLFCLVVVCVYALGFCVVGTLFEKTNRETRRLLSTDSLTGAMSRRAFMGATERASARVSRHGGNVSMVMMVLDNFNRIEREQGRVACGRLMAGFARQIKMSVREGDKLGRVVAGEFVLLLAGMDEDGAVKIANRIREEYAENGADFTISMGVAVLEPGESADHLVQRADTALYIAQENGGNRVDLAPSVEEYEPLPPDDFFKQYTRIPERREFDRRGLKAPAV